METKENANQQSNIWLILCKDWLLLVFISALGFVWEQVFVLITMREIAESGFLHLPICPIYGFTIIGFFYLIGTPHRGRYALKHIKPVFWRYAVYALFAFLLPSLIELGVGVLFDKVWDVRFWDYSSHPLNIGGYVSLPISLAWTVALTLFMRILFSPMRAFFQSASAKFSVIATVISATAIMTDFIYCLALLILR